MKKALHRKEVLIGKHHQNLARWQSILQNGIPPTPDAANDPTIAGPTGGAGVRQPVPDTAARATPAPRQSPATAALDPVRAPSTPISVMSPAASLTPLSQPQQAPPQSPYQTTQPPSPYPGAGGPSYPQPVGDLLSKFHFKWKSFHFFIQPQRSMYYQNIKFMQ